MEEFWKKRKRILSFPMAVNKDTKKHVPKVDCVAKATVSTITAEVVRVVIRPIRLKANYGTHLKPCVNE